jgi:hypothetical protein
MRRSPTGEKMARVVAALLLGAGIADACSSALVWDEVHKGRVVSARTMDYSSDLAFSLWKVWEICCIRKDSWCRVAGWISLLTIAYCTYSHMCLWLAVHNAHFNYMRYWQY